MSYAKEFSHLKYTIPKFLLDPAIWQDQSWHNDMCPRFENEKLGLAVWVAETDPTDREEDDWAQFVVVPLTLCDSLFSTDSIEALEAWLDTYTIKLHLEAAFKIAGKCSEHIADELASLIAECVESLKELETTKLEA